MSWVFKMRAKHASLIVIAVILLVGSGFNEGTCMKMEESENESNMIGANVQVAETAMACTFLENRGQLDDSDVLFYGRIPGGYVGFGASSLFLWQEDNHERITLEFTDAMPVMPQGVERVAYSTNYFLGSRGTYTDIPGYGMVSFEDLWPGIDMEYRGTESGAKYQFVVDVGADPQVISFEISGAQEITLSDTCIEMRQSKSTIIDDGLEAYQSHGAVDARFVRRGESTVGVEVGEYDPREKLVIDPLLYSTYVGGSDIESFGDLEIDEDNNVYITGYTRSSNMPTVNPYDGSYNGNADIVVFKLNPTGDDLVYLTYVGGTDSDQIGGSAIGNDGCIYVTGTTSSTDFPTVNAYDDQRYSNPFDEGFVFKLNPNGDDLLYSTYVNLTQEGRDIEVDAAGNMYVAGSGYLGYPIDPTHVFKISANGSKVLYAFNYTSGQARAIAIDDSGCVYVTGNTNTGGIPTKNAFDDTFNGDNDAWLIKLNETGGLEYGTYLGGTDSDRSYGVAVNDEGCAYVTGITRGSGFPILNAYDDTYGGSQDAFVTKFNPSGSSLNFSTFVGGSNYEYGYGIVLDERNNIYVVGETLSSDFPTVNAIDDTFNGERDVPVWKLNATGNGMLYSTYLGGSQLEFGWGVALDNDTNLYVGGSTESTNFPMVNPYDGTYNGGAYDFYVTKIADMSDEDFDGLPNYNETLAGTDRFYWDSDFDLMSDGYEVFCGLNPLVDDAAGDLDEDTLTNLQEYNLGTWAFYYDTDFDFLPDPWEVEYGTDPLVYDSLDDPDDDTLDNYDEYMLGTHPYLNDTDFDLLLDAEEGVWSCDPLSNDTDSDSILDGLEVHLYHTSPISNDSDSDTLTDPVELFVYGSNPLLVDSDSDLMPDPWEAAHDLLLTVDDADEDPDEDTLTNLEEYEYGTDPHSPDTDGDGIGDAWEIAHGYDPTDPFVPLMELIQYNLLTVSVGIGGVVALVGVLVVLKRKR